MLISLTTHTSCVGFKSSKKFLFCFSSFSGTESSGDDVKESIAMIMNFTGDFKNYLINVSFLTMLEIICNIINSL